MTSERSTGIAFAPPRRIHAHSFGVAFCYLLCIDHRVFRRVWG
ncbi:hypothetical protein AKJ09_01083 [Labilithrix luteola]|uniref:Uncharacterized protein n=1 Tax=Labilithrix luteola TaxID=1391654 RepID=A0A0K1PMS9_9BACT|nr:hypothetical protein AKJ09_01083 [Labilithrix luteola]